MSKRAIIYPRVSSEKQGDDSRYSIPTQIQRCRDYCARHAMEVVAVFREEFTGTVPFENRPDGRKALEMLKSGEADALIVYTMDRLARPPAEGGEWDVIQLIRSLARLGAEIHTVNRGLIKSTFVDLLVAVLDAKGAGDERRQIVERTVRGREAKAQAGLVPGCHAPRYGYRYDQVLHTYVIDEHCARIVALIFDWYTGRLPWPGTDRRPSVEMIAAHLTEMGERTAEQVLGRRHKGATGKWTPNVVWKILREPAYIGRWTYHSPTLGEIEVEIPPIVDTAVWHEAQALLVANRTYSSRNGEPDKFALRGMIRCDCGCGGTFVGGEGENGHLYYRPYKKGDRYEHACDEDFVPRDNLEQAAWEYVRRILDNRPALEDWLAREIGNVAALERTKVERLDDLGRQWADAQREADRLGELAKRTDGPLGEAFLSQLDALNERMKRIRKARREVESQPVASLGVERVTEMLKRRDRLVRKLENPTRAEMRATFEDMRVTVHIRDGQATVGSLFPFVSEPVPVTRRALAAIGFRSTCEPKCNVERKPLEIRAAVDLGAMLFEAPAEVRPPALPDKA